MVTKAEVVTALQAEKAKATAAMDALDKKLAATASLSDTQNYPDTMLPTPPVAAKATPAPERTVEQMAKKAVNAKMPSQEELLAMMDKAVTEAVAAAVKAAVDAKVAAAVAAAIAAHPSLKANSTFRNQSF